MLNHIVLMGRLTRDPELRRTGSGIAVASFSLAVDRDFGSSANNGEKETDFIDIVAWRNTAEFVSKYFTKGRSAEVVADNVYFGDSKRDAAGDNGGYSPAPSYGYSAPAAPAAGSSHGYAAPSAPAPASDFSMIEDDDSQLPF